MAQSIKFVVKSDSAYNRWLSYEDRRTICLHGFKYYFHVPDWAKTVELILHNRPAESRLKVEIISWGVYYALTAKNTSGLEQRAGLSLAMDELIRRRRLANKNFYVECYYTE